MTTASGVVHAFERALTSPGPGPSARPALRGAVGGPASGRASWSRSGSSRRTCRKGTTCRSGRRSPRKGDTRGKYSRSRRAEHGVDYDLTLSQQQRLTSGWNCAVNIGFVLCMMPSFVPSLALMKSGVQSAGRLFASSAKPCCTEHAENHATSIERKHEQFHSSATARPSRRLPYILGRDKRVLRQQIDHRLVLAAIAEGKLVRWRPCCKPHQLVAEANAEDGLVDPVGAGYCGFELRNQGAAADRKGHRADGVYIAR